MSFLKGILGKSDSSNDNLYKANSLISTWQQEISQLELEIVEARLRGLSQVDVALRKGKIEGFRHILIIVSENLSRTTAKQNLLKLQNELPGELSNASRQRQVYNMSYAQDSPPEEKAHAEGVLQSIKQVYNDLERLLTKN